MSQRPPRPVLVPRVLLWRALAWISLLGPFFFLTYNFANAVAARRAYVPVIMFSWERRIPFLPGTILPYWLTD